jgi:glutamate-1-semialdehyde 2,1-aminomutase
VQAPPLFVVSGQGPYLYDSDGNRYIDYLMSWGALILGHVHPEVQHAIEAAAGRGTGFGLSTGVECDLAETIKQAFPSIELLRLVNSGTEAVMSAVRLARGYTKRDKIMMFEGCYHGHSDGLLARAGSGLTTFGLPASAGVPCSFTEETLIARFNDLESVETICRAHGDDLACILLEPVAGNMGVIPPKPGFLAGLRNICDRIGALLVFDEVITGFRIAWGGAQEKFKIRADLTTLGKIIGGGLPVGAFGGRREIMEKLAPLGDVYQAGTLSGNPLVASAGKAVLDVLGKTDPYKELELRTREITDDLSQAASLAGIPLWVGRAGSMFTLYFTSGPVKDYQSAKQADDHLYSCFFKALLERGLLLPPSQWESAFMSLSHLKESILQTTIDLGTEALKLLVADSS